MKLKPKLEMFLFVVVIIISSYENMITTNNKISYLVIISIGNPPKSRMEMILTDFNVSRPIFDQKWHVKQDVRIYLLLIIGGYPIKIETKISQLTTYSLAIFII